jgi:hypothetical protein
LNRNHLGLKPVASRPSTAVALIYNSFTFLLPGTDNSFLPSWKLTVMKIQLFLPALVLNFTASLLAAELNSDSTERALDMIAVGCGQVLPASPRLENALETFQRIEPLSLDPVAANERLAHDAISPDASIAQPAIVALRALGPSGLETMLSVHAESIRSHTVAFPVTGIQKGDSEWLRLRTALDAIARQRDSYTSKLYWFTDFEQAKAAAHASGKPILSLRLLGNLDDELSCANSRFFRTTLYANAQVSAYIRDHFILHWKSVRPVPKVTIDFGDGRKLERTITGNSIHYVLDSDGRIIDALPGLYGAQAFLTGLQQAEAIAIQYATSPAGARNQLLHEYHCARVASIESDWSRDLVTVRSSTEASKSLTQPAAFSSGPPSAAVASRSTFSKTQIERPLLHSVFPDQTATHTQLESVTDDSTWASIAALHSDEARLDQASRALLLAKAPSALTAGRLTASKILIENPVLRQIRNLERSISEDTVRNEYLFHTKIHEWLAAAPTAQNLDAFNSKVYAELFLTPDSDPWLGLAQPDICTALENNGLVSKAQ